MNRRCPICERITRIKANRNPFFVKELQTGYVVLGDHQFYRGYTIFLCKIHAEELHELHPQYRARFLQEMAQTAKAVFRAFKPDKLNYELLGNLERHLHWHLFPRYKTDPEPTKPVWVIDENVRNENSTRLNSGELNELKRKLLAELNKQYNQSKAQSRGLTTRKLS